ncbi:MAG TPA: CrcB family protein [Acidimicrobiales bacterium]
MGVAVGAAAGAVARYLVAQALHARAARFPWATLAVNVTGSFALGLVIGLGLPAGARAVVGTGFVGAFTTFSTFALDLVRTAEDAGARPATGYVAANVVGGLAACAAALALTGAL